MNSILGFAELLKESDLKDKKLTTYVEFIQKGGYRLLNIINDIINISKIESGITDLHISQTDIKDSLEFVYNSLKLHAENKKIKFSYKCIPNENDTYLNTDKEKLIGILTNLIRNAIKFTDSGSVAFGFTKNEKEIEFYVKDTGIGIPKNKHTSIFERFIQIDIFDKMARQGSGLGLAISKSYVEMLGGSIGLDSTEGKGSTFYFSLPITNDI
jgi:signal transduction histidine kinase